ncbi:MAG: hypothetical protein KKE29_21430 [Proteobacteria bacterium]|nr:hypothetical protein [Pseudomonadota bacterium]MBU4577163.1 hypothetical protein [Pseudomonadota bacterium]MBU4599135.1 hypothetical protein [Pseudomonadota bacterium]
MALWDLFRTKLLFRPGQSEYKRRRSDANLKRGSNVCQAGQTSGHWAKPYVKGNGSGSLTNEGQHNPWQRNPRGWGNARGWGASAAPAQPPRPKSKPKSPRNDRPRIPIVKVTVYHGTPTKDNAKSILRDGFMVGSGNGSGDGIYFSSNKNTAKSFAGSGVYLACRITGRVADWNAKLANEFKRWCQKRNVAMSASAQTGFLLSYGYQILRNGDVYVVLRPQTVAPAAYKFRDRKIKVLAVHRACDDRKVRL